MSQLLTVMLIGRQAFLILMATEARRPQSVSHDIRRLANPPCWRSQLFLENWIPWVLFGRPPGAKGAQQGGKRQGARVGCQEFWVGFQSSEQQVLLGQSGAWSQEGGGEPRQETPGSQTYGMFDLGGGSGEPRPTPVAKVPSDAKRARGSKAMTNPAPSS